MCPIRWINWIQLEVVKREQSLFKKPIKEPILLKYKRELHLCPMHIPL